MTDKYFDSDYFNKDYFTNGIDADVSGYNASSFILENDVFLHQAEMLSKIYALRGKQVLDIGCARNNLSYWFLNFGVKAHGIDISQWCYENSHYRDGHISADVQNGIQQEPKFYSAIVSFETFEHFRNPEYVIKECARTLKPGGRFFATIATGGHEHDASGVTIEPREWWTKLIGKYLEEDTKSLEKFKAHKLVQSYKWSVHCYRKHRGSKNDA